MAILMHNYVDVGDVDVVVVIVVDVVDDVVSSNPKDLRILKSCA